VECETCGYRRKLSVRERENAWRRDCAAAIEVRVRPKAVIEKNALKIVGLCV
jgi:hypothetical protein